MSPNSVLDVPDNVIAREVGGETVILNVESGNYFGLDPIGARIWDLLAQGLTLAAIGDVILGEYEATRETIEQDLLQLATDLVREKLVQVRS